MARAAEMTKVSMALYDKGMLRRIGIRELVKMVGIVNAVFEKLGDGIADRVEVFKVQWEVYGPTAVIPIVLVVINLGFEKKVEVSARLNSVFVEEGKIDEEVDFLTVRIYHSLRHPVTAIEDEAMKLKHDLSKINRPESQ